MRLKLLLRYPRDRILASKIVSNKKALTGFSGRPLVLDLTTPNLMFDAGRHLFSIAHYAAANDSQVMLRCRGLILSGIVHKVFGRALLESANVTYLKAQDPIPDGSLVLSDHERSSSRLSTHSGSTNQAGSSVRQIYLRIGRDLPQSSPVMPYPMHPWTLQNEVEEETLALANQAERDALILFAGCQKPRYGRPWMEEQFGVLSRLDILNTVRREFSGTVVEHPRYFTHHPQASRAPSEIRILNSRDHSIPAKHWLPTLANAHFFLCGPGGRQPICHHLTEAMAVGTIPILEYGDRVFPRLTDGVDSIQFSGREGLIRAIQRIHEMDREELDRMREQVSAFYREHLCGKKFLRRLLQDEIQGEELAMPFHEKNLY